MQTLKSGRLEARMTIRRPAPFLDDPQMQELASFEIDIIGEADGEIWAADPQSGYPIDLTSREQYEARAILYGW